MIEVVNHSQNNLVLNENGHHSLANGTDFSLSQKTFPFFFAIFLMLFFVSKVLSKTNTTYLNSYRLNVIDLSHHSECPATEKACIKNDTFFRVHATVKARKNFKSHACKMWHEERKVTKFF